MVRVAKGVIIYICTSITSRHFKRNCKKIEKLVSWPGDKSDHHNTLIQRENDGCIGAGGTRNMEGTSNLVPINSRGRLLLA